MNKTSKSPPRDSAKRPPWKRAKPRDTAARIKLSEAVKAMARERAEKAGRRYPNLVDNMWAAQMMKRKA